MRNTWLSAVVLLFCSLTFAETKTIPLTVESKAALENVPVRVQLAVPKALANGGVTLKDSAGKEFPGQLTSPSLLATPAQAGADEVARELNFVLPAIKAGETHSLTATLTEQPALADTVFAWNEKPDEFAELKFGDRPVLKYMCAKYDDSSPEKQALTMKVYHHLYDPAGKRTVTNAAGSGKFPHHRGIFYGFMKCSYKNGPGADTWHGKNGYQGHKEYLSRDVGPVLGRHRVLLTWNGKSSDGPLKVFALEERELTVYNTPGGTLVEFASRLKGTEGKIAVDGDPQHAGFHFRADSGVEAKPKETYFVRVDGVGEKGATRNWPALKTHVDLPWNAMSFMLGDDRFTVAYLDKPTNPKEARFSERDYGRFGSYFVKEVPEGSTLDVNYRLWLVAGELTVEAAAAKSAAFVEPPIVRVK